MNFIVVFVFVVLGTFSLILLFLVDLSTFSSLFHIWSLIGLFWLYVCPHFFLRGCYFLGSAENTQFHGATNILALLCNCFQEVSCIFKLHRGFFPVKHHQIYCQVFFTTLKTSEVSYLDCTVGKSLGEKA